MPSRFPALGPTELIRIRELLSADEDAADALSAGALRERDRATGRALAGLADKPIAQIMAWYLKRETRPGALDATAAGLVAACLLAGALAGAITAFGAFFYDGGQRVNVLLILALFAALPLLSIVVFVCATLSRDGLAAISGGQFAAIIARVVPGAHLAKLASLATGAAGPRPAKWLLLAWSQWLGLGYGAGALMAAMGLVLFTDLAFGWSTTVEVSTPALSAAVRVLAWPWQTWLPDAIPDEELIRASRYFRLGTEGAVHASPAELARWWPFVVLAMLYYGVFPRLLTLPFARWRLRTACAHALLDDGRVLRLLQRMNTPLVRTESPDDEVTMAPGAPPPVFADLPVAEQWHVINWAQVPVAATAFAQLLGEHTRTQNGGASEPAGGSRSSTQDGELIARLAGDDARAVLVIAPAWEPPTLELLDFIGALRAELPAQAVVAIMPVAVRDGAPAAPTAAHQQTWEHALGRAQLANVHAVALREKNR